MVARNAAQAVFFVWYCAAGGLRVDVVIFWEIWLNVGAGLGFGLCADYLPLSADAIDGGGGNFKPLQISVAAGAADALDVGVSADQLWKATCGCHDVSQV